LIGIITPNIKKLAAAWKFWLPLVIGAIAGVAFLSKLVTVLLENHEVPVYWFFIGIIAGGIPSIYRKTRRQGSALPSLPVIICCIFALAVMIAIAVLNPSKETALYTELTPRLFRLLAVGGAAAAIAMIIPGISGSFLLLVIGLYRTVVQAVSELNIPLLVPIAIGIFIGLFLGAAFVRFLLAKVPAETYGAVLGLVAGSVIVLYPGGWGSGVTIIISVICMLAGGSISYFSSQN